MNLFKGALLEGAALTALLTIGLAGHANANYSFSGSGTSGYLDGANEPWNVANGGWGSPGISFGITPYTQSEAAYGMDITFTGPGMITPGSVAIGNGAACAGDTGGGTTFCTISPDDIWEAFQTGPESIDFLAQNASFNVTNGQEYFVNILFTGGDPTSFSGEWLTNFSPSPTPEPSAWAMMLIGFGAAGVALRSRARLARTS